MNQSNVVKTVFAIVMFLISATAPAPVLARTGGGGGFHGGGGGFHGGGGGYHGGGGYSGWHGGGYHGGYYGHGSYYGGRVGYWGYPRYGYGWGYGWGINVSFGWGGYWPYGYSYPYGYGVAWAPPYDPDYYPYYRYYAPASAPVVYVTPSSQSSNYSPGEAAVPESTAPARLNNPSANTVSIRNAAYTTTPASYRPASSTARQLPAPRPEVQNVIRALRGMPPSARQRQIDSGRYNNLSPQELEFAKYAADLPSAQ